MSRKGIRFEKLKERLRHAVNKSPAPFARDPPQHAVLTHAERGREAQERIVSELVGVIMRLKHASAAEVARAKNEARSAVAALKSMGYRVEYVPERDDVLVTRDVSLDWSREPPQVPQDPVTQRMIREFVENTWRQSWDNYLDDSASAVAEKLREAQEESLLRERLRQVRLDDVPTVEQSVAALGGELSDILNSSEETSSERE